MNKKRLLVISCLILIIIALELIIFKFSNLYRISEMFPTGPYTCNTGGNYCAPGTKCDTSTGECEAVDCRAGGAIHCAPGTHCVNGECVPTNCTNSTECGPDTICVNGDCIPDTCQQGEGDHCAPGTVCVNSECVPIGNCDTCSIGCHPTSDTCGGGGICVEWHVCGLNNANQCVVLPGQWTCNAQCPEGCEEVESGGNCSVKCNPCTNGANCLCPNPSPPPSEKPPPGESPSPSPSGSASPPGSTPPQLSLVCTSLSRQPTTALNINDTIRFTCIGTPTNIVINHYEFRLSTNGGTTYNTLDSNNTVGIYPLPSVNPYVITGAGNYVVQCRVCSSSDNTHCTTWGQAGGWTP